MGPLEFALTILLAPWGGKTVIGAIGAWYSWRLRKYVVKTANDHPPDRAVTFVLMLGSAALLVFLYQFVADPTIRSIFKDQLLKSDVLEWVTSVDPNRKILASGDNETFLYEYHPKVAPVQYVLCKKDEVCVIETFARKEKYGAYGAFLDSLSDSAKEQYWNMMASVMTFQGVRYETGSPPGSDEVQLKLFKNYARDEFSANDFFSGSTDVGNAHGALVFVTDNPMFNRN